MPDHPTFDEYLAPLVEDVREYARTTGSTDALLMQAVLRGAVDSQAAGDHLTSHFRLGLVTAALALAEAGESIEELAMAIRFEPARPGEATLPSTALPPAPGPTVLLVAAMLSPVAGEIISVAYRPITFVQGLVPTHLRLEGAYIERLNSAYGLVYGSKVQEFILTMRSEESDRPDASMSSLVYTLIVQGFGLGIRRGESESDFEDRLAAICTTLMDEQWAISVPSAGGVGPDCSRKSEAKKVIQAWIEHSRTPGWQQILKHGAS